MTQTMMEDCRMYVPTRPNDWGLQVVCAYMTQTKMEDRRLYVPT